jgi:hypothetical protein
MIRFGFAVVALLAALTVWSSSASAHARRCGTVHLGPTAFAVTIEKGHASCATARHVLRVFFSGGGVHHDGSDEAHTWVGIGHWRCGRGTGGGGCIRGGRTYVDARDYIIAQMR